MRFLIGSFLVAMLVVAATGCCRSCVSHPAMLFRVFDESAAGRPDATVTVDGVLVPSTVGGESCWLDIAELSCSHYYDRRGPATVHVMIELSGYKSVEFKHNIEDDGCSALPTEFNVTMVRSESGGAEQVTKTSLESCREM